MSSTTPRRVPPSGPPPDAFAFGSNWQRYLSHDLDSSRELAAESLARLVGDLRGKRFCDVGCGSGLFSLCAYRAGASEVVSVDVDPDSVSATLSLHTREGSPQNWRVLQGSILDADFVRSLPLGEVVYSWGVLHHTGDMYTAIRNAASVVEPGGLLAIAIYNRVTDGWLTSERWWHVKRAYNRAHRITQVAMESVYAACRFVASLRHGESPLHFVREYRQSRGMSFWTYITDWLGGYPYEFASGEEIIDFCQQACGLRHLKLIPVVACDSGNNEFLFVKPLKMTVRGSQPAPLVDPAPPQVSAHPAFRSAAPQSTVRSRPTSPFVLLSTQRSGTSWVMERLAAHPGVGAYGEMLLAGREGRPDWPPGAGDRPTFVTYLREHGTDFGRPRSHVALFPYLDHLYEPRRGFQAIGFKLMYDQAVPYPELAPYVKLRHIRVLHLVRANVLDIAISQIANIIRGFPWARSSAERSDLAVYVDPRTIHWYLRALERRRLLARTILRALRCSVYELSYERLQNDDTPLYDCLDFLGVAAKPEVRLSSTMIKLTPASHRQSIANFGEIEACLTDSRFQRYLRP